MKILYLTIGDHVDYQNDCLLIGLKELFGTNVVDFNKQLHSYDTFDEDVAKGLYGRGMTVTRVLPDLEVDRTDIPSKIRNKYYDYVVYGSIWRYSGYLDLVLENYPTSRVVLVDGEDETTINELYDQGVVYFKRELIYNADRLFPISFAIPTIKVNLNRTKVKDFSYITPKDRRTYIYNNELDYYQDYNEARFGTTCKKAGWDCLRHYEILANSCIPTFEHIEACPQNTMTSFPKELCLKVNKDIENKVSFVEIYEKYIAEFENHLLRFNTTKAEATKFIDTLRSLQN